ALTSGSRLGASLVRDTRAERRCARLVDRSLRKIRSNLSLTSVFRHSRYAPVSKRGGAVLECDNGGGRRVNRTLRRSTDGCEKCLWHRLNTQFTVLNS